MADPSLKIYSKKDGKIAFIYGKVGELERLLFPKGKPQELNKSNLFDLLVALQRREVKQVDQNQSMREKLLSYLDKPYKQKRK